jgi:hypothetical protein
MTITYSKSRIVDGVRQIDVRINGWLAWRLEYCRILYGPALITIREWRALKFNEVGHIVYYGDTPIQNLRTVKKWLERMIENENHI